MSCIIIYSSRKKAKFQIHFHQFLEETLPIESRMKDIHKKELRNLTSLQSVLLYGYALRKFTFWCQ